MHIVFILSFTELILLNLFIVKFSKKAEITARFSEDTLNQQILSIDNEFKNGKLTKKEAENQKIEVLKEAQKLTKTAKILKILKFLVLTVSFCAGLLTVPLFFFFNAKVMQKLRKYTIIKVMEVKMSYEVLEKQIRALPEEALEDVSNYLDKISLIYQSKQSVDFSFVDNIFGTLNDSEADELRSCCGLKFRENA